MTRKTASEIVEENKKFLAEHPELKSWQDIHDFTLDNRKTWANEYAKKLVELYPNAKTVEDVIDQAKEDGRFENEDEMLMVWGRLLRILPNRLNTNGVK